jgi:DNA-directed RNA polymerase sigma subunit (sigma70/sigma32)
MKLIEACIQDFNPRQRQIFSMRYPRDPEVAPKKLCEVGTELKISGERVRQIEQRCLLILRRRLAKHGVNPDILVPCFRTPERHDAPINRISPSESEQS